MRESPTKVLLGLRQIIRVRAQSKSLSRVRQCLSQNDRLDVTVEVMMLMKLLSVLEREKRAERLRLQYACFFVHVEHFIPSENRGDQQNVGFIVGWGIALFYLLNID